MADFEVRVAGPSDLPGVAEFRWDEDSDEPSGRAEFVADFVEWVTAHPDHHCVVALDGKKMVGMAWLAVLLRVPGATSFARAGGDIQTVFVLPEYRGRGIGTALMRCIAELTTEFGLTRVTVQSSTMGLPLYERAGFSATSKLLARDVT